VNISLVIPSRNNLKYVKYAYKSIRDQIGSDVEIILLDDASTDKTWDWMKSVEGKYTKIYRNEGPCII
jgi:glycosyltransferase involved in cell wall biosynthesis